jgi:hypothetical protein
MRVSPVYKMPAIIIVSLQNDTKIKQFNAITQVLQILAIYILTHSNSFVPFTCKEKGLYTLNIIYPGFCVAYLKLNILL